MKIAVITCGKMTATMELSNTGMISVLGRTIQKRGSEISINDIAELPMSDVMQFRDRRSVDEPLTDYQQALVNEIWEQAAEDEPWFSFCSPNFANAEEL